MNTTNSTTSPSSKMILPQEATANLMWQIFPPILLVFGTVGNVLSIVVLTKKTMRKSSVSIYLTCLAVADLLALYSGLLRQWIIYTFKVDIRELHPVICKVNTWLLYVSLDLSAWILVSVTVERAISVWLPHRVKVICTKNVLAVNILVLVIILMSVNGHFLFGIGRVVYEGAVYPCANQSPDYAKFLDYIFPWIDMCLFCLGPFAFHLVGNTLIITRLMAGVRTITQMNVATTEQTTERRRQVSSMTNMLLSLNLVYLVCTLPISIYLIYTTYWEKDTSPKADAQRRLLFACANLPMYLNNSMNFVTYTLSGRRFRSELVSLFKRKRSRSGSIVTHSTSTSSVYRSRHQGSGHTTTGTNM
ncbi:neuromedin-U receptor 2-like [Haliotis rufescens]|uniref:neuromedin-U receptor 2-like n=1 Tax=Haliotis rufescens TaxID=6454 RepID=UPI001EB03D45|nr:neuromedin-U receptor 2-like [Haliotis rufescens]